MDSAFLAPRFKLAFLFVNLQMYREAAEVVAHIEGQKNTLSRQQKNLLNYFQAMLLGDSETAYRYY